MLENRLQKFKTRQTTRLWPPLSANSLLQAVAGVLTFMACGANDTVVRLEAGDEFAHPPCQGCPSGSRRVKAMAIAARVKVALTDAHFN
jgi:hypothetical protein